MTAIRSVALGCGSYLPKQILTNADLAAKIDTSDEWIVQRTGIRERHVAAEGEFTSHLAINAAQAALADAGVDAQSIDLIVLATSTPDNTFPATAVAVQHGLGINHGAAFEYDDAVVDAIAQRCTEVDSGARNIDNILTGTVLPEVSGHVLEKMAAGGGIGSIRIEVGEDGAFAYSVA